MTNNVMKQLSRKLPHPMGPIPKDGPNITNIPKIIGPIAFQVNRFSAQEPCLRQPTHFKHFKGKLIIVTHRHLQTTSFCHLEQCLSFLGCDGEWFFQINMASELKALLGKLEMALWRSGDVDHLWLRSPQHFPQIAKAV